MLAANPNPVPYRLKALRRVSGSAALALLLATATACKSSDDTRPRPHRETASPHHRFRLGYFAPEFYAGQAAIMEGVLARARERGWELQLASANSNAQTQASQLRYFADRGLDAVVVVPVDSNDIVRVFRELRERRIGVFTIDRAPTEPPLDLGVLSDNYMAGKQSAEALLRLKVGDKDPVTGPVLELAGDLRQNVAQLRGSGFHSVLDQHPDLPVERHATDWSPSKTSRVLEQAVAKGRPRALYLHSDAAAVPVALEILGKAGYLHPRGSHGHVPIVGVDCSPAALAAIRAGFMDQCSAQPIASFGLVIEYIEQWRSGHPIRTETVTRPGELWSPAQLSADNKLPLLLLATTSVNESNCDDSRLWGNALHLAQR